MTIVKTADGSPTIKLENQEITYHSVFGAVNESMHVFINAGLKQALPGKSSLAILEMGFGTGLNALLSAIENGDRKCKVYYETFDLIPLSANIIADLNYCSVIQRNGFQQLFMQMHTLSWNQVHSVTDSFTLKKRKEDFASAFLENKFDLVYYDAFDPAFQPELWTPAIFDKIGKSMNNGAILVTYSSKGSVRRALESAGFRVEKLPGPSGKREMVRAHFRSTL